MAKKTDPSNDEIKSMLTERRKRGVPLADFVSTGSTMLNLACSDRARGGYAKGHYYYLVGDSTSGKTWLTLTCMAEMSINPSFANYDFYFDNVEDGALMDLHAYFGPAMAKRMKTPGDVRGEPGSSTTVESFYYNLDDCIENARKTKRPFVYVLDSQDALDSEAAEEKFEEQKEAHEKGKESKGSYGDGKAKYHSGNIRRALIGIRETESILIIIGQTRDNVTGMGFDKKTRSGGRSLRFYATLEIWTSIKEKLKKRVLGKERPIGVMAIAVTKKNRFTGRSGLDVPIPIYTSTGIDDVGSCVDYLIEEGHWEYTTEKREKGAPKPTRDEKDKQVIVAEEFDFTGTRGQLIQHIENENLEPDLQMLCEELWLKVKEASSVKRKNKYHQ